MTRRPSSTGNVVRQGSACPRAGPGHAGLFPLSTHRSRPLRGPLRHAHRRGATTPPPQVPAREDGFTLGFATRTPKARPPTPIHSGRRYAALLRRDVILAVIAVPHVRLFPTRVLSS